MNAVPVKLWSSTGRERIRQTGRKLDWRSRHCRAHDQEVTRAWKSSPPPSRSHCSQVLPPGKRARLRRLLFEFGPGNGTLLLLPIDQGIEHGPRDFFPNPASKDPEYQFRLAAEAGYSAIACQIGLAEKYYPDYAGQVPLILKVNGKTDVPPSDDAPVDDQRLGRGRGPPRRRRSRLHDVPRLAAARARTCTN